MIYKMEMLNCTLLLDSASRFGLVKGTYNYPSDTKKDYFLVSFPIA